MQQKKNDHFFAVCPKRLFLIPFFCLSLFLQTAQAAEMLAEARSLGITTEELIRQIERRG